MDRKLEREVLDPKKFALNILGGYVLGGIISNPVFGRFHRSTMNVEKDQVSIATVEYWRIYRSNLWYLARSNLHKTFFLGFAI